MAFNGGMPPMGGGGMMGGMGAMGQRMKLAMHQKPIFKLAVYFTAIPALLFYVLTCTGAVSNSPGMAGIYIERLRIPLSGSDTTIGDTNFIELRIGYFGLCMEVESDSYAVDLYCQSSWNRASQDLIKQARAPNVGKAEASGAPNERVHFFVQVAQDLQKKAFGLFPGWYPVGGILFIITLIISITLELLLSTRQIDPDPQKRNVADKVLSKAHMCIAGFWASTAWVFGGALATTEAVLAQRVLKPDGIQVDLGVGGQFLQWGTFAFCFIYSTGITILYATKPRSKNGSGGGPGADPGMAGMAGGQPGMDPMMQGGMGGMPPPMMGGMPPMGPPMMGPPPMGPPMMGGF